MDDFMTTIGRIAEVFDGPHATPIKTDVGPYYLSISSLENGRLDLSKSAHLSEEDFKTWTKRVTPQKGDLLFSYETRLGEAALMPDGIRACLGRRMGLLRPRSDKVISEYLLYAYLSPAFQQTIVANTITGATVDRIALNEFSEFPIRIPSLDEQKKVAGLLKNIDAKIELNARINAELESMAKTLYDYWFVQFAPHKSAGGGMVWNDALKREIPLGWEVKTLGDIVSNVKESTSAGEHPHLPYVPIDNLPMKKLISAESSPNSDARSSLVLFKKHDILVGAMRVYFHRVCLAIQDGITRTTTFVLRPKEDYLKYYSLFTINKDESIEFAKVNSKGTTMPYTFWDNGFEKLVVLQPPKNLLDEFNKIVEPLLEQSRVNELESQTLTELRDWLLPMLMNGQIQVQT